MKTFAIFGNPVKHSKSPAMHQYFFNQSQIDAKYLSFCLDNGKDIKKYFKEKNLSGANITVPFKEDAFLLCDEVRGVGHSSQSVNTIINENNKLIGYNTDADGFLYSLKESTHNIDIKNALILGAGGTAKSIAIKLKHNNIKTTILNRSTPKLKWFKDKEFQCFTHSDFKISTFDMIINTTSAGLSDENFPLEQNILKELFKKTQFIYDVIYNKETPFIKLGKSLGIKTQNGKDMLIYQGAFASLHFMEKKYSFKQTASLLRKGFGQ